MITAGIAMLMLYHYDFLFISTASKLVQYVITNFNKFVVLKGPVQRF